MKIGMHIDIKKRVAIKLECGRCGRDLDFSTQGNVGGDEFIFSPEPCETCIETAIEDEKFEPKEQSK